MNITKILHPWKLAPELDFGWTMKTPDSAKTSFEIDTAGVYHLKIEHDRLKGITPAMLYWWFCHIGGNMTYQGKTYSRYLVWHPKDHIYWHCDNAKEFQQIGIGAHFRIVEAFGRNRDFLIDSTEVVTKLDESGIKLVRRIGGVEVFSLQHDFIADGTDTIYRSYMKVGAEDGLFKGLFNSLFRPLVFSEAMAQAWLKHNIEEVGNFEFFLAELYEGAQETSPPLQEK